MTMINDIKRDRAAGTQGPWGNGHPTVYTSGAHFIGSAHFDDNGYAANARRIARVPDMEAALLAADELADAVDEWQISRSVGLPELEHQKAKVVAEKRTAYRKATGADQ